MDLTGELFRSSCSLGFHLGGNTQKYIPWFGSYSILDSLKPMRPQCSMAPDTNSGMATRSGWGGGIGCWVTNYFNIKDHKRNYIRIYIFCYIMFKHVQLDGFVLIQACLYVVINVCALTCL